MYCTGLLTDASPVEQRFSTVLQLFCCCTRSTTFHMLLFGLMRLHFFHLRSIRFVFEAHASRVHSSRFTAIISLDSFLALLPSGLKRDPEPLYPAINRARRTGKQHPLLGRNVRHGVFASGRGPLIYQREEERSGLFWERGRAIELLQPGGLTPDARVQPEPLG